MIWLCLLAPASLLCLLAVARYRHRATAEAWDAALSPEAGRLYDRIATEYQFDVDMAAEAWMLSEAAKERADLGEALRQMNLAMWVVSDCTPGRIRRLRGVIATARMLSAVAPMPHVPVSDFRLRRSRAMSGSAAVVYHALITAKERLVWRARLLAAMFGMLVWTMRRASEGTDWQRFGDALADWKVVDREALETWRVAIMAIKGEG